MKAFIVSGAIFQTPRGLHSVIPIKESIDIYGFFLNASFTADSRPLRESVLEII